MVEHSEATKSRELLPCETCDGTGTVPTPFRTGDYVEVVVPSSIREKTRAIHHGKHGVVVAAAIRMGHNWTALVSIDGGHPVTGVPWHAHYPFSWLQLKEAPMSEQTTDNHLACPECGLALVATPQDDIDNLRIENKQLREALTFIAESPNWKPTWRELATKSINGRYQLCVQRAQEALGKK